MLTKDEIQVLFDSNTTIRGKKEMADFAIHAYRFLLLSDLRPGELLGLQWRDIKGDALTVSQSLTDDREISRGKNENARRTIKLIPAAVEELRQQKLMLKMCGVMSPYVFPAEDGMYITQENFRVRWQRYCISNGIGYRGKSKSGKHDRYITPYEFRHTSFSINKKMPDGLKKMAFGHSRTFNGDSVYSHEMAGDLEVIAEYTEKAFDEILEK